MDKTKPFGLVMPKREKSFRPKSCTIFDSDSDNDLPPGKKFCTKIPQAKLSKIIIETKKFEDPTIYEYDSIYDDMKAQEIAKIAPKETNKPSRYIDTLLKAADKRKKEYERRVEKKVQNEREKEGDKFQDKEAFVTSTYKKKLQEREEEEERERRENMLNDMMDVTKQKDLSGFYRHFLKQSVGEEKVPTFGERDKVKMEMNDNRPSDDGSKHHSPIHVHVKEENCSDHESSHPNNDLDKDSDIVSSSDEENTSKKNESQKSDSDSDAGVQKSSNVSKTNFDGKSTAKNETNKKEHRRSEDSDFLSEDKGNCSRDNDDSHKDCINNITNVVKKADTEKSRKNIFDKRTVGIVFAEAQARYFQRVAARSE